MVQVLPDKHSILGEPPSALLALDDQIERLIQLAVQASCVVLLIRLGDSRRRPLNAQLQLFSRALANLCIARDLLLVRLLITHRLSALNQPSLRIANKRLTL